MQAVQEDNQRKAAELESLRTHLQRSSGQKPVPPPFPSELANYSVQSEQASRGDHQTIVSPIVSPRRLPPPLSEEMMEEVMMATNGKVANPAMTANDATMPNTNPSSDPKSSDGMMPPPSKPSDIPSSLSKETPSTSIGSPKSHGKQPPAVPKKPTSLLQEIQEAPMHVRLRKVPKWAWEEAVKRREADGTPIRVRPERMTREPSLNDQLREKMRERIRMMEDSEPEEDVHWRESDVF